MLISIGTYNCVDLRSSLRWNQDTGPCKEPDASAYPETCRSQLRWKVSSDRGAIRSQFYYIDAYSEPQLSDDYDPQLLGMSRQFIEQMRNTPMHLCRLCYFGNEDSWFMDFYTYSHKKYEPCVLNDGDWMGTPEQAFDASSVYLSA
jgi:hypothetical protein